MKTTNDELAEASAWAFEDPETNREHAIVPHLIGQREGTRVYDWVCDHCQQPIEKKRSGWVHK